MWRAVAMTSKKRVSASTNSRLALSRISGRRENHVIVCRGALPNNTAKNTERGPRNIRFMGNTMTKEEDRYSDDDRRPHRSQSGHRDLGDDERAIQATMAARTNT
jgi:hypothetical protein